MANTTFVYIRSEVHEDDVRRLMDRLVDATAKENEYYSQYVSGGSEPAGESEETVEDYRLKYTDDSLSDLLAVRRQVRQGA